MVRRRCSLKDWEDTAGFHNLYIRNNYSNVYLDEDDHYIPYKIAKYYSSIPLQHYYIETNDK